MNFKKKEILIIISLIVCGLIVTILDYTPVPDTVLFLFSCVLLYFHAKAYYKTLDECVKGFGGALAVTAVSLLIFFSTNGIVTMLNTSPPEITTKTTKLYENDNDVDIDVSQFWNVYTLIFSKGSSLKTLDVYKDNIKIVDKNGSKIAKLNSIENENDKLIKVTKTISTYKQRLFGFGENTTIKTTFTLIYNFDQSDEQDVLDVYNNAVSN